MSIATDSNTATAPASPATVSPATEGQATEGQAIESPVTKSPVTSSAPSDSAGDAEAPEGAVERALAAAVRDAAHIGDLLEVLRTARLWLPLPADGTPAVKGTAVTLPTVSYLGSDFVPAYSSASL